MARGSFAMLVAVLALLLAGNGALASKALQSILKNTHQSPAYEYPTDLTREIIPIPVHSHNDYWRDVPFYSALAAGCMSIEADVWLYNGTLYVGHHESSLTKLRTLESLYIEPLLDTLKRQNPTNEFDSGETRNGVYDTDPLQTIYLFVDLKTDGAETWPHVVKALQPLRDANYLTSVVDNKTFVPGPVTVIGTGNTPLDLVAPLGDRDYFFDAPLADLDTPEFQDIARLISPIASTNLNSAVGDIVADDDEPLDATQLETIRKHLKLAKKRDIRARYWETPDWPVRMRNAVWRALLKEGVGLLNADDLEAVGEYF